MIDMPNAKKDGTSVTANPVVLLDSSANPLVLPSSLGQKTAANSMPVALASDQTPVPVQGIYNLVPPTLSNGQTAQLQMDMNGALAVRPQWAGAFVSGFSGTLADAQTNTIVSIVSLTRGFLFNGSTWDRQKKASAVSRIASSAASTNGTVAKASAGDLFAIQGYNTTASVVYLKLYNKASAPTVGTDTPIKTIPIPPNAPIPANCAWANGLYFSAGIAFALTGAAADSDTTAVAAGAIVGLNLDYQ